MTTNHHAEGRKMDTPTVCPICGNEFPGWKSGNKHEHCLSCDLRAMRGERVEIGCSFKRPKYTEHPGLRALDVPGPLIPLAERHQLQIAPRREIPPPCGFFCPYPTHGASCPVPRGNPPVYRVGPASCPERDREDSGHAPGDWCETCWAAWFWGSEPWKLDVADIRRRLREGRGLPPYGCRGADRQLRGATRDVVVADRLRAGYSRDEIAALLGIGQPAFWHYLHSRPLLANLEFSLARIDKTPRFSPPVYEGRRETHDAWRDRSILATDLADRVSRGTAYPELVDAAASLGLSTYDDEES